MTLIAPSILSADFGYLLRDVEKVTKAGADWLHIDVMDGHFVPNISFGLPILQALKGRVDLPLDVHLMIDNPESFIPDFAKAGADILVIHPENQIHVHRLVHMIKNLGLKAGLALNPHTPLNILEYILEDLDLVMLMSVNPGFGGQKFIPATLKKVADLKAMIMERGLNVLIEIDGGVNLVNAAYIRKAGADILVAGSAVFSSHDWTATIKGLKGLS